MIKEFALEPGERVIGEVRKHWFVFLLQLLPFAILGILPFALPGLLGFVELPFLPDIDWDSSIVRIFTGLWLLLTWTGAFAVFTNFYLDLWILTNFRIVDINQRRFFHRDVSSLVLTRVQDITVETNGILASILNIGNINVQSAGAEARFTIRGIPNPNALRDTILQHVPNGPANV